MMRHGIAPTAERPQGLEVDACMDCGGVWVVASVFKAMIADAEVVAPRVDVRPEQVKRRTTGSSGPVRYRSCPHCGASMLRRNFERISGVVLDECPGHGTFFDPGELQDVIGFVRTGGLVLARRAADREHAREAKRIAQSKPSTLGGSSGLGSEGYSSFSAGLAGGGSAWELDIVEVVGRVGGALIGWSVYWLRRIGKSDR
jgi:Zn-finger nucleic acid-binding protein